MAAPLSIFISDPNGCLTFQIFELTVGIRSDLQKPGMKSCGVCAIGCSAFRGSDRFTVTRSVQKGRGISLSRRALPVISALVAIRQTQVSAPLTCLHHANCVHQHQSRRAANRLTLVVRLGSNIPHELQRENNSLPLRHFEIFEGTVEFICTLRSLPNSTVQKERLSANIDYRLIIYQEGL